MDAFDDNTFGQPESDPAAEFLAREQDALAGLDDDLAIPPAMTQGKLNMCVSGVFVVCPALAWTCESYKDVCTSYDAWLPSSNSTRGEDSGRIRVWVDFLC